MNPLSRLFVAATVLGLVGCNVLPEQQADTVRYFTLIGAASVPMPAVDGTIVRPVQLAGHLRNRSMAVRVAENEVVYLDDVRWAESLGDAVTNLLRARLGTVGGSNIVTVQIQRCELVRFEGNGVQLTAIYSILSAGEGTEAKRGVFTSGPRTWDGKNYGLLVGQLRDAVNELSDAIAADLPTKK